jgi:hypothetical protein
MELLAALLLIVVSFACIIGGGWLGDYVVKSMHDPALARSVVVKMYVVGTILFMTALGIVHGN